MKGVICGNLMVNQVQLKKKAMKSKLGVNLLQVGKYESYYIYTMILQLTNV